MKIVVTGMVGIDKQDYLQQVERLADQNGRQLAVYNVGRMMYEQAPDIPEGKILNISLKRLESLRRGVFTSILSQSEGRENIIINTHATFRWKHGLFAAADFDLIRQFRPDMLVCIIDGIDAVHLRLNREHKTNHSLKDLLVWREEEILGTELLAKGLEYEPPFICLARGFEQATAQTFYELMFEQHRKKVYLSYPMTHVASLPDVRADIKKFCSTLKQHFICFDPGDLEETYLPVYAKLAMKQNLDYVETVALGQKIRFGLDEVLAVKHDIDAQIYARDFALIDQSDMIISYIPELPDGSAAISSGVERELQHAHEAARDVYVIWKSKKQPSVFVTQTATRVFSSCDEALYFFHRQKIIGKESHS